MLKLGQLKVAEGALNKLLNADIPVREAYRLSKMAGKIALELQAAETIRVNLVKKYGVQEGNNTTVLPDKLQDFVEEYNKLLDVEVDIQIEQITLELIEGAKLSPMDIVNLKNVGILPEV